MERALKSFLDGIGDDDNVVHLEEGVKNDNDDDEEPAGGVIAQGNASGMLDMRAMAQRYQQMSASSVDRPEVKPAAAVPLPGQLLRRDVLAPVVETEDIEEGRGLLIVGVALAVLVTIVSTAAITAVWVKRSVMAEISEMQLSPPSSITQNPAAVATNGAAGDINSAVNADPNSEVAEWPEADPALAAAGNNQDDSHLEMNFDESEVAALRKRREREAKEANNGTTPVPVSPTTPIVPAVVEGTSTTTTTATPDPTPTPKAKVAADGEPCDEVLCLVEGRGCCGTAKKAKPAAPEIDTSLPERLGRNDVKEGLAKIDGRLGSCGTRYGIAGVVTLKLQIGADGKVKKGSANKGDAEFQSCVAKTLKKARFTKTQQGAKLSYPVIMR